MDWGLTVSYIEPKATKWRSGPPPSIGWWPASTSRWASVLRWWDGQRWSRGAHSHNGKDVAMAVAMKPPDVDPSLIKWTDRWWE